MQDQECHVLRPRGGERYGERAVAEAEQTDLPRIDHLDGLQCVNGRKHIIGEIGERARVYWAPRFARASCIEDERSNTMTDEIVRP